jgi:hypothetical protein
LIDSGCPVVFCRAADNSTFTGIGSRAAVLLCVAFGIAICASQQRFAAAHFLPANSAGLELFTLREWISWWGVEASQFH